MVTIAGVQQKCARRPPIVGKPTTAAVAPSTLTYHPRQLLFQCSLRFTSTIQCYVEPLTLRAESAASHQPNCWCVLLCAELSEANTLAHVKNGHFSSKFGFQG